MPERLLRERLDGRPPIRITIRVINTRHDTPRRYRSPLREEQTAATRARILDALLDLLAEDGNHAVTLSMEQVAARARVSKPTLYRHFPNKASLFQALAEATYDRVTEGIGPARLSELDQVLPKVFHAFDERAPFLRILLSTDIGRQARTGRTSERRALVAELLAPVLADLDEADGRRLEALALLLTSSAAYLYLKDHGLGVEDAAAAASWAVLALAEKAGERKETT